MSGIVGDINSKSRIIERPEQKLFKSYESADDILTQNPNAKNGVYWINGPLGNPIVRVYCDLTSVSDGSTQAGGYMLVGRFTSTSASRTNWESSTYSKEYETDTGAVMSKIREYATFQYLRIVWNGGEGASAPIYDYTASSGGLVNVGSRNCSRVSSGTGSTGILTTSSWGLLGAYSASTLYNKVSGAGDRAVWYSNYSGSGSNQDGLFGNGGLYGGSTLTSGNNSVTAVTYAEFWIR